MIVRFKFSGLCTYEAVRAGKAFFNKAKRIVLNFLVIAIVAFASCKKEDDDFFDDCNVYVAGVQYKDGVVATVWKNGVAQYLTNGTNEAVAYSIYVSNDDVYVAGYACYEKNSKCFAAVWKNGVIQHLTDGTNLANAYSVFVSDNDVYVAGYEEIEYPDGFLTLAKLWKNGEAQTLDYGVANSVFVSNGNVYVAGSVDSYKSLFGNYVFGGIATVWKNGIGQCLTDETNAAHARSVFVYNDIVYVTGYEYIGQTSVAKLWTNSVVQNLTDGTRSAEGNSVFVSGGNVYVAGYEYNLDNMGVEKNSVAKLWTNGKEQTLNGNKSANAEARSVYVSGDDVYVAGYEIVSLMSYSKLWINGKAHNLKKEKGWASANSVFVIKK